MSELNSESSLGEALTQPQRTYDTILSDAVAVLTEAARLRHPILKQIAGDTAGGRPRWEPHPTLTEPADWAEFVTLAIAGAAANIGGVEAILVGRPGSWEAEGIRQLLHSTVGLDLTDLWRHRIEPIEITLYVDELLTERSDAWVQYQDAAAEISAHYDEVEAALPPLEDEDLVWTYERNTDGSWVSADPAAPVWSTRAWLDSLVESGMSHPSDPEALLESASSVYLARSSDAAAELRHREDERDAILTPIADLEEGLEVQRLAEWQAYGESLRARVEQAATALPGLTVPVRITIDTTTYRRTNPDEDTTWSLETRLIDDAMIDIPTPADLEGSPLDRLAGFSGPNPHPSS